MRKVGTGLPRRRTLEEYPEKAEAYLDLYSKKADVPKQKIHYWVPVVAAAELSRNRKESEEFLKSWIDVANDYE